MINGLSPVSRRATGIDAEGVALSRMLRVIFCLPGVDRAKRSGFVSGSSSVSCRPGVAHGETLLLRRFICGGTAVYYRASTCEVCEGERHGRARARALLSKQLASCTFDRALASRFFIFHEMLRRSGMRISESVI